MSTTGNQTVAQAHEQLTLVLGRLPEDRQIELLDQFIQTVLNLPVVPWLEPEVAIKTCGQPSSKRLPRKFETVEKEVRDQNRKKKCSLKAKERRLSKRSKVGAPIIHEVKK